MTTARLRRVGGSTMLAIPPAILEELKLAPEAARKRYGLDELLTQCDREAPLSADEREWLDAPDVGREILP